LGVSYNLICCNSSVAP